jgi:hypothetical protein
MARALVRCDVRSVPADALTVDALSRLQLVARRRGAELLLANASAELAKLVDFIGLGDVFVVEGQAEQREEALGVEEEREADDLPVDDVEHLE